MHMCSNGGNICISRNTASVVTVNLINPVILFLAIKSAIKAQVKVDTLLLGEAMVGASRHDSQLLLFMDHKGKGKHWEVILQLRSIIKLPALTHTYMYVCTKI